MNEFGTLHDVRTVYCGLFELRICDALKLVSLVGPRRSASGADRVGDTTVESNREWAISKTEPFAALGYEVDLSNCSVG